MTIQLLQKQVYKDREQRLSLLVRERLLIKLYTGEHYKATYQQGTRYLPSRRPCGVASMRLDCDK